MPPRNHMIKIQLEFAPEKVSRIETLMQDCAIRTKKELFNNAIALLEWAVQERLKGNIIAAVDEEENRFKDVCLPIFPKGNRKQPAPQLTNS